MGILYKPITPSVAELILILIMSFAPSLLIFQSVEKAYAEKLIPIIIKILKIILNSIFKIKPNKVKFKFLKYKFCNLLYI